MDFRKRFSAAWAILLFPTMRKDVELLDLHAAVTRHAQVVNPITDDRLLKTAAYVALMLYRDGWRASQEDRDKAWEERVA